MVAPPRLPSETPPQRRSVDSRPYARHTGEVCFRSAADDHSGLGARRRSLVWTARGKPWELRRRALAGGTEEVLATGLNISATSFSPDGKWLIYVMEEAATGPEIWLMPLDGDRKPRPLVQTPYRDNRAAFSPDGK